MIEFGAPLNESKDVPHLVGEKGVGVRKHDPGSAIERDSQWPTEAESAASWKWNIQ